MALLLILSLVAALNSEQNRDLADRYNTVQAAIEQQDYDRAAQTLSRLVRDYGGSEFGDELHFALAETYFNLGQYQRATELFKRILSRPRYSYIGPEAMYGLAISSIMLGNFRQARLTLEDLTKKQGYDKDPRTNFAFGVLHYFQGEYEQAVERLEGLDMPEAMFYLAKCYSRMGRPLPALLEFKNITVDMPNTPLATLAQFAAGHALFLNRDYDAAQAKFQFFLDNFPYSPLADFAHYFIGCALVARKDHANAIGHLMPLTRHRNNYLAAHANYFIGYAYMALDQPVEAVEKFQRVRANYPNTKIASFANLQLSQAMLATEDTAQTLLSTSQLAEMFKSGELSGVGNYLSGVIFYQTREYADAARQFETVLISFAETALREPACAMLLLSLNSSRQFEKAVAVGAKYVADFQDDKSHWRSKTLYFLAEGFYHYRKYNEADMYFQRAYALETSSEIAPYARLGRCYCLYHLGRLSEAGSGFKGLLNARTADTLFTISAYLGYGYSLFNQAEYLQALDVFEALSSTFPNDALAAVPGLFYTGYCYYQLEYYGQAVDAWAVLMNKYPEGNDKVAEAAFRSGDTYFKALEYDKAVATFSFVVERHPYSPFGPPSQALIAQCWYNQQKYMDAVREYQKFLDIYPSDPQGPSVRKSLEMSYFLAGQTDSAVMEDFLHRFPQSEMAAEGQFQKGRGLFDGGQYEQAALELQKAFVNFPGSPVAGDAQLLTAEAYAQLEKWEDAARAYKKFLDYFPEHGQRAGAYFNMAIAYFNLGQYRQAIAGFQVVLEEFPDSEYTESARENIDVSQKRLGAGVVEENLPFPGKAESSEPGQPAPGPAEPEATEESPIEGEQP